MPEIRSFVYRVEVYLALNRDEITHLIECSKRHGDVKCHAASTTTSAGEGFLIGWRNRMDWAEESGAQEVEVLVTHRQMDTLCKILEVEPMMAASKLMKPEEALYFPIRRILVEMGEKSEALNAEKA